MVFTNDKGAWVEKRILLEEAVIERGRAVSIMADGTNGTYTATHVVVEDKSK